MQIFDETGEILFEQFLLKFPVEGKILMGHQNEQVNLLISDQLIKLESAHSNPVFIDAASKLHYHQRYFCKNSIYKEPLARALGIKKGVARPVVLDATAGMLGDSLLMLSMGAQVIAYERHPIVALLIVNAINNGALNIDFYFGDATTHRGPVDVVFFDPMYTEKNDKALPKKEMRLFRDMVGKDQDAELTAKHLLKIAPRMVIKRSIKARPLISNPQMTINGKSTSYDVYLRAEYLNNAKC